MPEVYRYSFFELAGTIKKLSSEELDSLKFPEFNLGLYEMHLEADRNVLRYLQSVRQSSKVEQLRIAQECLATLDSKMHEHDELSLRRKSWVRNRLESQEKTYVNSLGAITLSLTNS